MKVAVVGVGLIGGSMAISLKEKGWAQEVVGVDRSAEHLQVAIDQGIIDRSASLEVAIDEVDVLILATPVNAMVELLPMVLDKIGSKQVVTDVGSSKGCIAKVIQLHPNRGRFVSGHPMAGTEFAGPQHAISTMFENRCTVLCDRALSEEDALETIEGLYTALNMTTLYMESDAHDIHAAYVSHISHISSFALALTVLEKEKNESRIFEMAGGGFSSTVRLAKSNPKMWIPIFEQNRDNVLDVLDEHINTLSKFRSYLIKRNFEDFEKDIVRANHIKRIIK